MIKVESTPSTHDPNSQTITGGSVADIIKECMNRVRPQSKDFYMAEIEKDLKAKGESVIDRHAGMGIFYKIKLL